MKKENRKETRPLTDLVECTFDTPLGPVRLLADDRGLAGIVLPGSAKGGPAGRPAPPDHPLLAEAARQIRAYLAGERTVFSLPLAPRGTPFQLRVWELIGQIPHGRTMTYGAIAQLLGDIRKARSVGGAAHANPLPLVIPCHRVIGADGSLTGFACGLAVKEMLLKLERGRSTSVTR
jgi:methylated-DNA-[protein]-cysteine S-methyltransferase